MVYNVRLILNKFYLIHLLILEVRFLRWEKWWRKFLRAWILFNTKIKTTYIYVLWTTKSLNLRAKLWWQYCVQVLSLKIGVFEHLDKIPSGSTGLRDEKSFYCGSLVYRLVLFHNKKKFWIEMIFHVGNKKNQVPPSAPNFWWNPQKISLKML